MSNLQRGFISPLLLALIAALLLGGGVYVYAHNKQANQSVVDASVQATSTAQTESIQSGQLPTAPHILSNTYSDLTEYENALVKKMSAIGGPDNAYILKWYDDKTAVFIVAPPKDGGASMDIYDIKTLKRINSINFQAFGNYVETNGYMVADVFEPMTPSATTSMEHFIFYKKGATDFQIVPNSSLSTSETYAKGSAGMGSENFDVIFDEPTKTITASIFRRVKASDVNTKLRTVKFVLP